IVYFLETGSDPDFDVVGESMIPVQENMARLPASDREAIAAFLKTLPARPDSAETP
ncbi:MAG: cytochrome C, partial [Methyloceanibacter sp.]